MPKQKNSAEPVKWKLVFQIAAAIAVSVWLLVFGLANPALSILTSRAGGHSTGYSVGLRLAMATMASIVISLAFLANVASHRLDD